MVSYYRPTKWWKDWSLIPTLTRGKSTNTPIHRNVIAICFHNFPRTLFRIPPPVCQNKSGMNCWLTRGFYGWLLAHSGVIWRDRICQDSSLIKKHVFCCKLSWWCWKALVLSGACTRHWRLHYVNMHIYLILPTCTAHRYHTSFIWFCLVRIDIDTYICIQCNTYIP